MHLAVSLISQLTTHADSMRRHGKLELPGAQYVPASQLPTKCVKQVARVAISKRIALVDLARLSIESLTRVFIKLRILPDVKGIIFEKH